MSCKIKTLLVVLLAITSCTSEEKDEKVAIDDDLRSVVIELAKDNDADRNARYALCIVRDDATSSHDEVATKMLEEISSVFSLRPSNQTLFQRSFDKALVSGDKNMLDALLKRGEQELSEEQKLHTHVILDKKRVIKDTIRKTTSATIKLLGNTALGKVDDVKRLLTNGTTVISSPTIRTAWWYAVRNKHPEVARLLLKTGKLAPHEALIANAVIGDATKVQNILEDENIGLRKGDIVMAWYVAKKNDYLQIAKIINAHRDPQE